MTCYVPDCAEQWAELEKTVAAAGGPKQGPPEYHICAPCGRGRGVCDIHSVAAITRWFDNRESVNDPQRRQRVTFQPPLCMECRARKAWWS